MARGLQGLVLCAAIFGLCSGQLALDREDFEVAVEQGTLLGKIWNIDGRKVQVFKGVPYAEPPVGERRFKKPMKKQPWSQPELAARTTSRACVQFMDFHINDRYSKKSMKDQGEDCLYLNIYAPFDEPDRVFPVMVWIHGGSYLAGSGDTGVDEEVTIRNIVLRDVVLVTINYRLGPLGFISSDVDDMKGNFGLWDQIEALRWIKANIAGFGGNSDSVTVMGESAGAASVSILALSPLTKDLLHSAIIMSGSSAAGWAVQRAGKSGYDVQNLYQFFTCKKQFNRDDLAHIFRSANVTLDIPGSCNLMKKPLDCSADDQRDMFECLRRADFSDAFFRKALTIELGVSKAVVDGEIIPYAIDDLIGNASRVPILTGVAASEWYHKKRKCIFEFGAKFKIDAVTKATKATRLEADIEFVAPCQREADSYAQSGTPVYLYSFEHVPKSSFVEEDWTWQDLFGEKRFTKVKRILKFDSAFHGLDHAYVFNKGYTNNMDFQYDDEDKKMSDLLCNLITNFVKFKNPTPSKIDDTVWQPYTKTERRYARVRLPFSMVNSDFYRSNSSFWNEFMPNLATRMHTIEGDPKPSALTEEERLQLTAYRKAWWALWILVAAIAVVLWTLVVCLVAQKCLSARSGPYKNIIVANR